MASKAHVSSVRSCTSPVCGDNIWRQSWSRTREKKNSESNSLGTKWTVLIQFEIYVNGLQYGVDQVAHTALVCRHLQLMRFVVRCQLMPISLAPWAHIFNRTDCKVGFYLFHFARHSFHAAAAIRLIDSGVFFSAFRSLEPFFILI